MYKKSAVILGLALLVGCSDTTVDTTETKPKPTVSAPATPAPVSTEPDITAELEEYNQVMQGPIQGLIGSMGTFSELNTAAAEDPTIMFTGDWKTEMALTLTLMEEYINQAQEINPPAELNEVHDLLLEGLDYYQYVVDNFPKAIDNMDVDLIMECVTSIENGTNYIVQATDKLESMK